MKTVIVGCGAVSYQHADALNRLGIKYDLCDIDLSRAKALKQKFNTDSVIYQKYEDAVKNADCIHICTPHYLHAPMIIEALNKGKHVLTEKPLCMNVAELNKIREAVKNTSGSLGVCFQNRYLSSSRACKKLCEESAPSYAFGSVVWSRDADYYNHDEWRGKWATEGGGVLINQAIHTLDLLCLCLRSTPKYVTATVSNRHLQGVIEVEDTAELFIEFENGKRAQFYATTAAQKNFPVRICFGNDDNVVWQAEELWVNGEKVKCMVDTNKAYRDYWGTGHLLLIRDFYDRLNKGERFEVGVEEAGVTIRILDAAYKSNGNRMKIEE